MKYASVLAAAIATLVKAAPVDPQPTNAADGTGLTDYGTYSEYGAYGSYGQYDSIETLAAQSPDVSDPVQVAAPDTSPNTFVAVTTHSGDPNVHLRQVSANGQKFFIGKDTSTYCPRPDCSSYVNFTVFSASPNDPNSGLSLFTSVAGGQAVFVTDDGQLGYTQAHSGSTPPGSVNTPFQYTPETAPGSVGTLTFKSGGFAACPVADQTGVYQIYASAAPNFAQTNCTGIGIVTSTYTANPAWQYN